MAVKSKIVALQLKAEKSLASLLKDVDTVAKNENKKGRKLVEQATLTTIKNHEKFLKTLEVPGSPKFAKDFEDHLNSITSVKDKAGKPLVNTERLREEYNQWKFATNKVVGTKAIPNRQQSHKDHTVIGSRAFIIYTHLVQVGRTLTVGKADAKRVASNKYYAESFRRLYMTAQAISRAPDNILGNSSVIEDMTAAIDYFERTTNQAQWEVIKQKEINILSGKAEQELEIVLNQPPAKTAAEYRIGETIRDLWSPNGKSWNRVTEVLRASKLTSLQGSKALEDELVKQTTHLVAGKKPKPYRSKTKKVKKSAASGAVKGSLKLKALKKKKKAIKIAALAPAKLSEKGSEDSVRDLLKIQRLINKRLPAEVRRNMGRPALINQTGKFSNSVKLERLTSSAKGISGKYTYMLTGGGTSQNRAGVYETFENTGKKRWSSGYNPKSLITKSIRNLAIQYTDKKFTYLRRV